MRLEVVEQVVLGGGEELTLLFARGLSTYGRVSIRRYSPEEDIFSHYTLTRTPALEVFSLLDLQRKAELKEFEIGKTMIILRVADERKPEQVFIPTTHVNMYPFLTML